MIEAAKILQSRRAPAGRPQPLAFHDGSLWVGCWDTETLYAIDPATWAIETHVALAAKPYGIASFAGALHVVIGVGEADDRYVYRFEPGKPFGDARVACPEFTGSHLTTDGTALYLMQQTNRRMVRLGTDGDVTRTFAFPVRCAGIGFAAGTFYFIAADDDFDVLQFATLDLEMPDAQPALLASMHVEARGLAYDGNAWWTAHREDGDVVSFAV